MSTVLLSVMGAFAEFERSLIRERQLEGIALAKERGAYKERSKKLRDCQKLQRLQNNIKKARACYGR
jgi:DNA invertase Pin-like site-specific DNA recombinase